MSEPVSVFTHAGLPAPSTEAAQHSIISDGVRRKHQSQQPRQLLSCTKCRERKVKCDRTKPCFACCARGTPKECHFIAEGGDYAPIQQSYELRKLRAENLRLKERIRACKIPMEDDESDPVGSPESQLGEKPVSSSQKRRAARQRRFQGSGWSDSIYFGSPGLANVITDFATVNLTPMSTRSLAHLMPRGSDMYTLKNPPPHPFATLFKATPDECIPELLECIPNSRDELFECLHFFEKRVNVCSFPHVPIEITRSEVERFLSDARKNAQMCPDMLALLFAALALGAQHSVWDKSGNKWEADVMSGELRKGNVYMAAAMQALRMASFMHKPSLLGIQALIMLGPYLTNSGRFLDAWTLFGTTIRLAHSIGLHRHPKFLDPAPPTQSEFSIRQTLWWWMLHMDEQYSMTLGRPLGISGIGDCPPPHELTTNPHMLRFGEFVNHFTLLARQILSSDRLTNSKIDEFTDSLKGLLDTMPEMLQFDESWIDQKKEIPEWPLGAMAAVYYCKTHNYLILLNRQRTEKQSSHLPLTNTKNIPPPSTSFQPVNRPPSAKSSTFTSTNAPLRGRPLVLSSSEDLLTAFLFFHAREPAALICWTMGQQAFNSCMILLLDAMETGDLSRIWKVEKVYVVFKDLQEKGVHKLASLAVDRMSWGLEELRKNVSGPSMASSGREVNQGCHVEMQGVSGREAMHGPALMHDTVMGNTGMLLLEDPGLQSFVPEAFTPLTWGSNQDMGETMSLRPRQNYEQEADKGQLQSGLKMGFNENFHDARSPDKLQGISSSAQLPVPAQYGSFPTAASQEHPEPGGPTVSSSPASPKPSMRKHNFQTTVPRQPQHVAEQESASFQHTPSRHLRHRPANEGPSLASQTTDMGWKSDMKPHVELQQHELTREASGLHGLPPPHLQHHSYPSLHQDIPSSLAAGPPYSSASVVKSENRTKTPSPRKKIPTSAGFESTQCQARSPLQTLPELIPQFPAQQGNPNVHPSWAARPAAPITTSLSEPALSFTYMAERTQGIPALSDETTQQSTYQCTFPFHVSHAVSAGAASMAGTHAEPMEVEGWSGGL